ncbi:MAG: transcriptional regulator NrdR [Desulfobacterota bacterium]|nr:transcriptional regulator NrdR [Thermodesulfobacteriota bacterium]MDW8002495.1 transcriptional regulator NrdR [Deltaproteobacteria bacterium]
MKCPYCGHLESRVLDSRLTKELDSIKRKRECLKCGKRFTTSERVEEGLPMVIKKDGRREAFDRTKILAGLKKACEKRPISIASLERIVSRIEYNLLERGEREVSAKDIGEMVMDELKKLDDIAYVRFASVYRQFKDINEFMEELKNLLLKREEAREKKA